MTKVLTPNDLVAYLYMETSPEENEVLELLIQTDPKFHRKYQELKEGFQHLEQNALSPNEQSIQNILEYSRRHKLPVHEAK